MKTILKYFGLTSFSTSILFLGIASSANLNWHDRSFVQSQKEIQRIADRLQLIETLLRKSPTDQMTPTQKANRLASLDQLNAYWKRRQFPINLKNQEARIPVFIDDWGVPCAVGFLIIQSGYERLARQISESNNYAFLEDIQVNGLNNWIKESGFTEEELKLIQPTYGPSGPMATAIMSGNLNAIDTFIQQGKVNELLAITVQLWEFGNDELIYWLLENGADPNFVLPSVIGGYFDFVEITAFELAVINRNSRALKIFIDSKFDPNLVPLLPLIHNLNQLDRQLYQRSAARTGVEVFNLLVSSVVGPIKTQATIKIKNSARQIEIKKALFPSLFYMKRGCSDELVTSLEKLGADLKSDLAFTASNSTEACQIAKKALKVCEVQGTVGAERIKQFLTEQLCPL